MVNLKKITKNNKCLYLAYDQGLEHGPTSEEFNDLNIDPSYIMDIAKKGKFNGVIFQKGIAEKYYKGKIPLIIKLNGKTKLVKSEPLSLQNCSVKEAIEIGAKAVGYTVYVGSEHEALMLKEFGKIEEEAHEHNIPLIGWMYPRGKSIEKETPEITEYAARVGLELGADIVKVKYTGSKETFEKVVKVAGKCKVVCSGGGKIPEIELLKEVKNVMDAKSIGFAIGRNVWQHNHPLKIIKAVKSIIFNNKTPEKAMKYLR